MRRSKVEESRVRRWEGDGMDYSVGGFFFAVSIYAENPRNPATRMAAVS